MLGLIRVVLFVAGVARALQSSTTGRGAVNRLLKRYAAAPQQQSSEAVSTLVELQPGKAAYLVGKWKTAIENDISLGHLPQHTHPTRNVTRLQRASACFKDAYASCSALAVAAAAGQEKWPARVVGTPRSKNGAAVAVVVDGDEAVDVLHVVVNPDVRDELPLRAAECEILDAIRDAEKGTLVRIAKAARAGLDSTDLELDLSDDGRAALDKSDLDADDPAFPDKFPDELQPATPIADLTQVTWIPFNQVVS